MATGNWSRDYIGGGSFGVVEKWTCQETKECLAIKIPKYISNKTMERRWDDEIETLKVCNHPNVVAIRDLPEPVKSLLSGRGTILCMEFCKGGALRGKLRSPANRCGFAQGTVLHVIKDVAAGVEYLHAKKIMHRDLKPENVVIHLNGKPSPPELVDPDNSLPGVTYKLIDLGYAKNLREQSLAETFVGTQVYLPPELFIEDCTYSYPAEYWSLGTLVFECLAGKRPFFINSLKMGIATWYKQLEKKCDEHIYGIVESTGGKDVSFVSSLPDVCPIQQPYRKALEKWLQLVLRFDAEKRGGDRKSGSRPECFSALTRILGMKVVNVFVVSGCQTFSYSVDALHDTRTLQANLARDSKVPAEKQILLSAIGENVLEHQLLAKSLQRLSANNCWLFLYPQPEEFTCPVIRPVVHGLAEVVLQEPETLLSREKRKQAYEESIFLAYQMFRSCQRLMQSQRACLLGVMMSSLNLEHLARKAEKLTFYPQWLRTNAIDHLEHLQTMIQYLPPHLKQVAADMERDLIGQISILSEWMKEGSASEKLNQVLEDVREQVQRLQRHPASTTPQCDESFKRHVKSTEDLFEELQSEQGNNAMNTEPMFHLLNKCLTDFMRVAEASVDHCRDMLTCLCLCMKRVEAHRPTVEERLNAMENMRSAQLKVWTLVGHLLAGRDASSPQHRQSSGTTMTEPHNESAAQQQDQAVNGQQRLQHSSSHSGTVRSLADFLNTVTVENSSDNLLRESQALYEASRPS